jgi:hypothetical protein
MTERDEVVPEPSYLPPNPSVGELVTEIDRARHEAARTMTALVRKFDRPALRKPLAVARPLANVRRPLANVRRHAPRLPLPVWIIGAFLVLRWWRHRRRANRHG